jgi:hypothetical protein
MSKMLFHISPWENQIQAVVDLGGVPAPLSIFMSVESIPEILGVGLVQHKQEICFVSKISADPQKRPYGVRGGSRRAKKFS